MSSEKLAMKFDGNKRRGRDSEPGGSSENDSGLPAELIAARKAKSKLQLLRLAEKLGNVSRACREAGYSRDSFYRFKKLYEGAGEEALHDLSRRKPNLKNRVDANIENAVVELAIEEPLWGQETVSRRLKQRGLSISPAGVRCVWLRHGLETIKKRVAALEAKSVETGYILTETQLAALRRVRERQRP